MPQIDGLGSGLDTGTIISQLMQIERAPQQRLVAKRLSALSETTAWNTIGSAVNVLAKAAAAVTGATALGAVSATSSNPNALSITASAGAQTGTHTVRVNQLATSSQLASQTFTASTDPVGTGSLTLTKGGVQITVNTDSTTTLADLATSINSAAGGDVTASVVDTGSGFKLLLSGTQTGLANDVTASTSGLAGFTTLRTATDAQLTLDGLAVTRSTNTVSDLLPGATISLLHADPTTDITVSVASDSTANTASAKAVVDGINGILTTITTNTKYDVAASKSAPLTGDAGARALSSRVYSTLSGVAQSTGRSLSEVGISVQRDGSYSFDATVFAAALKSDPTGTASLMGAVGTALTGLATDATNGVVSSGKDGSTTEAADLQKQVDSWDDRLALIQDRYQKQFTALDVALSSLKSQGSWLSGQLSSLPR